MQKITVRVTTDTGSDLAARRVKKNPPPLRLPANHGCGVVPLTEMTGLQQRHLLNARVTNANRHHTTANVAST